MTASTSIRPNTDTVIEEAFQGSLFTADDIISTYTFEDGIRDGVLVDAHDDKFDGVASDHYGDHPVVLTAALSALIDKAVANERHCNDHAGVLHDVLWMGKRHARALQAGDRRHYQVIITGASRRRYHNLTVAWDGPTTPLTFGLLEEV